MEAIVNNWEWVLLGFMVAEKAVKLSPAKWDDILVDGFKEIFTKLFKK